MASQPKYSNVPTKEDYGSISEEAGTSCSTSIKGQHTRRQSSGSLSSSLGSLGASLRDGIHERLRYSGQNVSIHQMGGHSTIPNSSINLIKNLVGSGVFALPSGV
jgi:hypothetical protein